MKHTINIVIVILICLIPFASKFKFSSSETGVVTELSEVIATPLPHRNAVVHTNIGDIEAIAYIANVEYEIGDEVMLQKDAQSSGEYFLSDKVRTTPLLQLFILFIIVVLLVSGYAGVRSLLGLLFSFVVIFRFVLPQIAMGSNPMTIALIASIIILMVSYYLTHGINQKSNIAIAGTFAALLVTGILASVFGSASHLSGYGVEETAFLIDKLPNTSFYNLLIAGFIIGSLGILDDITISQASIVEQLAIANRKFSAYELYKRAMQIGHDHISSLVNTLVLVYAGSALPLLLLFVMGDISPLHLLNYEVVAEEIVRTLVGSIGLVTAVPLTTILAAWHFGRNK